MSAENGDNSNQVALLSTVESNTDDIDKADKEIPSYAPTKMKSRIAAALKESKKDGLGSLDTTG